MRYLFLLIITISFANVLIAQEQWEVDMVEEESKYYFDMGVSIHNVVHNILEIDNVLENIDTSLFEGKIEYRILSNQKQLLLRNALMEFDNVVFYYPTSSLINQSLYIKAQIHYELGQIDSACLYYQLLIDREISIESDTSEIIDIRDVKYYNFKNSAYKQLAEIEYELGNYLKSISHLDSAGVIGYVHFCGNEYAANDNYTAIQYAKNYYAIDSLDKAIDLLIPHLFFNGLTTNNESVRLGLNYMLQKYDRSYLIKELENGFDHYIKKEPTSISGSNKYFIIFLGQEVQLYMFEPEDHRKEAQTVKDVIIKEQIYQLLKG